jgi:hypothetical protein
VASLPRIDEHSVAVAAAPPAVWDAVLRAVERAFASSRGSVVARALGCHDLERHGARPFAEGSAFPGFHVVTADAHRELALAGSHRFSRYTLIFRLDEPSNGTVRLRAESRAEFPGVQGRLYRAAVIGSGGHAVSVRHLLTGIKRRAERP